MTDIVDLIERDHRDTETLFARFAASGDVATARAICDALDRHGVAEQVAVFPVIAAELPNGKQMAWEDEDEHGELSSLTGRIRALTDPSAALTGLVEELAIVVEQHVDAEETEVLPQVRALLEPERLAMLGREFQDAKADMDAGRLTARRR